MSVPGGGLLEMLLEDTACCILCCMPYEMGGLAGSSCSVFCMLGLFGIVLFLVVASATSGSLVLLGLSSFMLTSVTVCMVKVAFAWHVERRRAAGHETAFYGLYAIPPTPESHAAKVEKQRQSAIKALPMRSWVGELESPREECTLCMDSFKPGEDVRDLPCGHYYHAR